VADRLPDGGTRLNHPVRPAQSLGSRTEEITIDAEELAEARWFSRDEIREMVARAAAGPDDPKQVSLPSPIAIAHHICRRWASGLDSV